MGFVVRHRLPALALGMALVAVAIAPRAAQAQEARTSRFLEAFLASYNNEFAAGHLDAWMGHWAEDALSESSGEMWRGREQIRTVYQEMFNAWDRLALVRERGRLVSGNLAAWQGYFSARHRQAQRDVSVPVALFLTFNDSGTVQQARFYIDAQQVSDQLGEGQ